MDINEEAERLIRERTIRDTQNEEQREESAARAEILKAKREGLKKAYLKARRNSMWEDAHDLLLEIYKTHISEAWENMVAADVHHFTGLLEPIDWPQARF